MQNRVHESNKVRTIVGHFSETWNAEAAVEDLKFAGFAGHLRYQQEKDVGLADDTKEFGGIEAGVAKSFDVATNETHQDSQNQFSVNPEAEEYFVEAMEKKHHFVYVETHEDWDKAIDILRLHHGEVEVRDGSFFTESASEERKTPGETFLQAPRIHPTQAIERPKNSVL